MRDESKYLTIIKTLLLALPIIIAPMLSGCSSGNSIVGKWGLISGDFFLRNLELRGNGTMKLTSNSGKVFEGTYQIRTTQADVKLLSSGERQPQFDGREIILFGPNLRTIYLRTYFAGKQLYLAQVNRTVVPDNKEINPIDFISEPSPFRRASTQ